MDKVEESATALKRIEGILSNPAPYGMLKDAEGLIQTVARVNDRLVTERREFSLGRIDGYIGKVRQELDEVGASPDLRNQCFYPIQHIRQQVDSQHSIAHIYQLQKTAKDAVDEAIDRIEEAGRKVTPPTPPDRTRPVAPPKVTKVSKKRHPVYPSRLVPKNYLETDEDADRFLEVLRNEISSALERGERVEIK